MASSSSVMDAPAGSPVQEFMNMHNATPAPPVAFDVTIFNHASSSATIVPKRLRKRFLETLDNRCKSPTSLEEIENKLKEADLRRQQFHEWLANKAKRKARSSSSADGVVSSQAKLRTMEKKTLRLLTQHQKRISKYQAAKPELKLEACGQKPSEVEEHVETKVERTENDTVHSVEGSETQEKENVAESANKESAQEEDEKDKQRVEALRAMICQKIAAAAEKRTSLLKAERRRAQAIVLQAKRVATAVRRKRELELRNKKELLEARLLRAKRLRAAYLGQKGGCPGSCHSNGHKMKKHGDSLCRKLTRCWRQFRHSRKTTVMLAQEFSACDIKQATIDSIPFDDLASRITAPATLDAVRALLARIESRFLLSSESGSSVTQIDHLLKRLAPPPRKPSVPRSPMLARKPIQNPKLRVTNGNPPPSQKLEPKVASPVKKVQPPAQNTEESVIERYPSRVFLCAYMIISHPEAVFSSRGEPEDILTEAASKLIPEFEALVSIILDGPPSNATTRPSSPSTSEKKSDAEQPCTSTKRFASQMIDFDKAWCSYLYQFAVWKVQDAHLLEEDLIRVVCQLEISMLQKCPPPTNGSDVNHDSEAIRKQVLHDQKLLREKILRLRGPEGISRMEAALIETRKKCSEARENGTPLPSPFAEPRPREKGRASSTKGPSESSNSPSKGAAALFPKPIVNTMEPVGEETKTKPTTPEVASIAPGKNMDNERLVNEMIHEPNWNTAYSASSPPNKANEKIAEIEAQVKMTVENAFWDNVLEGLGRNPPDHSRIIGIVEEMKLEFESLVPDSWKQELNESIDVEIFSQVLKSGNDDYVYFQNLLDYALNLVLKLGAPARDTDTRASHEQLTKELARFSSALNGKSFAQSLVKGLRFVLDRIQVLRSDINAARIQALAPVLQGSAGIEYLQKAFCRHYMVPDPRSINGDTSLFDKLPKTAQWLLHVQQNLQTVKEELEASRSAYWSTIPDHKVANRGLPPLSPMRTGGRVMIGNSSTSSVASPAGVDEKRVLDWNCSKTHVGLGILNLISGFQAVTEDITPETLRLNVHRLKKSQNEYQRIIIMTIGLLILRQNAASKGTDGDQVDELLNRGKDQLTKLLDDPGVSVSQIGELLAKVSGLESDKDLITRVLSRSLNPEDAVFKRVSAAIQLSLRTVIILGKGSEGLAVVTSALQRAGAMSLHDSVVNLGTNLERLLSITNLTHGPWYASIVSAESS